MVQWLSKSKPKFTARAVFGDSRSLMGPVELNGFGLFVEYFRCSLCTLGVAEHPARHPRLLRLVC